MKYPISLGASRVTNPAAPNKATPVQHIERYRVSEVQTNAFEDIAIRLTIIGQQAKALPKALRRCRMTPRHIRSQPLVTCHSELAARDQLCKWARLSARYAPGFLPNLSDHKILNAPGAGAGLAVAFNAPIGGMIFVFEEFKLGFAPPGVIATLGASARQRDCRRHDAGIARQPAGICGASLPEPGSMSGS